MSRAILRAIPCAFWMKAKSTRVSRLTPKDEGLEYGLRDRLLRRELYVTSVVRCEKRLDLLKFISYLAALGDIAKRVIHDDDDRPYPSFFVRRPNL